MNVIESATSIRDRLKSLSDSKENPIDTRLNIIPPFHGSDDIKLIVIGQDPTIKNEKTRKNIEYTLNLDKPNSLRIYVEKICYSLGIRIDNVYATNLFKYFYSIPPAQTMDVLYSHLEPNLELLKEELSDYKNIPIITLGEPVLQLLTNTKAKVREYWDYNPKTGASNSIFTYSKANENKLGRDFYPFPHQPSIRKRFYGSNLMFYISYLVKTK